jgi:hypothetical protein
MKLQAKNLSHSRLDDNSIMNFEDDISEIIQNPNRLEKI